MTQNVPKLTVESLLYDHAARLGLRLIAGEAGLKREIKASDPNRPGLALAGYLKFFHDKSIQVFGKQEISYFRQLGLRLKRKIIAEIFKHEFPCGVVTWSLKVPPEFVEAANRYQKPLLVTSMPTSEFIISLTYYTEGRLTPSTTLHGGLVDVYGVGIFFLGKSGVGKSECTLELIERGHRLVSDDVVEIRCIGGRLIGSSTELIQHHMEIRGLGVINIRELYGAGAICPEKEIELVANLELWKKDKEYDRLGVDESSIKILGVDLPQLVIPVKPGRNIAVIIEVAAKNHRLKEAGHFSAQEFNRELLGWIRSATRKKQDD